MYDNSDEILNYDDDTDGIVVKDFTPSKSTPTIDSLIGQWNGGALKIPNFQRKFVWTIEQCSKFIESLLLEIPIPSLTFYEDEDSNQLIVDGQQRMKSIILYTGNATTNQLTNEEKDLIGFKLKGLSKDSKYHNLSYTQLSEKDKRKLMYRCKLDVNTIELDDPSNLSTVYYIFERLNTGGTPLSAQEIRNCICAGTFNDFLIQLNSYKIWREFFTNKTAVAHQKDIELILRFFALYDMKEAYHRPMKDYLTNYMKTVRHMSDEEMCSKKQLFKETVNSIYEHIGRRAFRFNKGLNSSILDSVMIAFANNLNNIPLDIKEKYNKLCENHEYIKYCSKSAGDNTSVKNRLQMANDFLFGKVEDINLKIIKLYDLPVSAGLGNFLTDEHITYSEITTTNRKADYAVKISGDSMEPNYHDGDILLIKKQNTLHNGELGIFLYDDEVRFKKYEKNKKQISLISLNKNYTPIDIATNRRLIILGLVLNK